MCQFKNLWFVSYLFIHINTISFMTIKFTVLISWHPDVFNTRWKHLITQKLIKLNTDETLNIFVHWQTYVLLLLLLDIWHDSWSSNTNRKPFERTNKPMWLWYSVFFCCFCLLQSTLSHHGFAHVCFESPLHPNVYWE